MTTESTLSPAARLTAQMMLQYQVEQFLYHEAALLDRWDWDGWFALLADDLHYYMPVRTSRLRRQSRPDDEPRGAYLAHYDDDLTRMRFRIQQRKTGQNWAEEPPSRARHLISNVRVDVAAGGDDEIGVDSNFIVYRNRMDIEEDLWAGERKDVLRRTAGGFEIVRRTVLLEQNVVLSKNLSVFF
ncbi:benzene 1,2-dioxygenase [Rhodococcoides fascians]|uniref:aromatic-ring-hydroxylating dioxygenase subunit beta n=1 Tax=Rhodococcoides fascians TaxID=1828 RepID=UPI000B9BFC6E|nr:3-phenylpropionate/cinnamic acid dioxygenase subunit beta [Rhodococcus fascians]OZE92393.1 benzene 1,2-dioxygenase [Rhodococcus fascians]OZF23026.1 benzene 1,2-dioxygenase [Rhodococcus fascians]OZF24740.1 benzene 1,2-dioxygenase [Rhodococcus fascians]OZF72989.1 benzene 1,2-dioxygenase [Rhodococcus fascians]OZF74154.1 benzene 1,2-dioxygenase [Rhodococcus fascians]